MTLNISVHTIIMRFEWDIYKAISNWFKHGVSFGQAATALEDPNALIIPGHRRDEIRYKLIGEMNEHVRSNSKRIVVVIYTMRGAAKRIISSRYAGVN